MSKERTSLGLEESSVEIWSLELRRLIRENRKLAVLEIVVKLGVCLRVVLA